LTIIGVLVLIGGTVLGFNAVFGNSTTTISFKEAFEQFADEQGSNVEVKDDGLPVPGVYRYQTTGGESTKLLTSFLVCVMSMPSRAQLGHCSSLI
jgi:hypothetical protein